MAADAQVVIEGHFPAGEKVALVRRHGDWPEVGRGETIDRAKVGKDSRVVFEGLVEGERFWAVGEDGAGRAVGATAAVATEPAPVLSAEEVATELAGTVAQTAGEPQKPKPLGKGKVAASHTEQGEAPLVDPETGERR